MLDPIYSQRSLFLNALLQGVDMLAETRAELDDFHQASKELEAELQNELQRTERAQREVQVKVIRAENERDEWKVHVAPESTRCQFTYLTLFFRISSCPFKQHTILPRLPLNVNSINSGKNLNTRRQRKTYANWKWETMIGAQRTRSLFQFG